MVKMQKLHTAGLIILGTVFALYFSSCTGSEKSAADADLIIHNAFVYPVDADPIPDGAVVIRDGKIMQVGTTEGILEIWGGHCKEKWDAQGKFLMPGLIEGHGHLSSLGKGLIQIDLLDATSWEAIVDSVAARVATAAPGAWIIGRGWHQDKWNTTVSPNVNGYPYHDALSAISPDHPVILQHASGHALMANQKAMEMANITAETPNPSGGTIVRNAQKQAIGVFEENAAPLIEKLYQEYEATRPPGDRKREWIEAIQRANLHCLQHGITTFEDAGSTFEEIAWYNELAQQDSLTIRVWAMLLDSLVNLKGHLEGYPILRNGHDHFTCRAIKSYLDGALGSYGAWLLEPYVDRPGSNGQITTSVEEIEGIAQVCLAQGMQFAVHAIGDKANRTVLDIYEKTMQQNTSQKELRWRIEHAQHIDPQDIPRFKKLGVIPSMQAIHCTSDSPFVVKRLGEERAKSGAYPWRSLLDAGAVIANGTDVPVERIDPMANLYASVTRKRSDTHDAFFPEQAMTREEALRSMTLSNAYAAFEEDIKGSITAGKWADLVLLSNNLLTCPEDSIQHTQVIWTMVAGKKAN